MALSSVQVFSVRVKESHGGKARAWKNRWAAEHIGVEVRACFYPTHTGNSLMKIRGPTVSTLCYYKDTKNVIYCHVFSDFKTKEEEYNP